MDFIVDNVVCLKVLFFEFVIEGLYGVLVDVDVLKVLVGECMVGDVDECYGFYWYGKCVVCQVVFMLLMGMLWFCFDDSVVWDDMCYLVIEGDNFDVMKLLYKSYVGKVKFVYIDLLYNIGSDFVYLDDFSDSICYYLVMMGQIEVGVKCSINIEVNGWFYIDWLNMMYLCLKFVYVLLFDEGLIVVYIDEYEVYVLVLMLCEIFGEENEFGVVVWDKCNLKGDVCGVVYQYELLVLFVCNVEMLFEWVLFKCLKCNVQCMFDVVYDVVYCSGNQKDVQKVYCVWMKVQINLFGGEVMYDWLLVEGCVYCFVLMVWLNKKKVFEEYFMLLIYLVIGKLCVMLVCGWCNLLVMMQVLFECGQIEFGLDEIMQLQWIYYFDENMYENVLLVLLFVGFDDVLLKMFGILFDLLKLVDFVVVVIGWCMCGDDIVFDCFVGFGLIGYVVMQVNVIDGGVCCYIFVQLFEVFDCCDKMQMVVVDFCVKLKKLLMFVEIMKECLCCVVQQVVCDYLESYGDFGFCVYWFDMINVIEWDLCCDDFDYVFFVFVEYVKIGCIEDDLFVELMFKFGFDLCMLVEYYQVVGKMVYLIGCVIVVCFDVCLLCDDVGLFIDGIVDLFDVIGVLCDVMCLFCDSGFVDDVVKFNFVVLFEQYGVKCVWSL